jgi:hypothetical protein
VRQDGSAAGGSRLDRFYAEGEGSDTRLARSVHCTVGSR